MSDFTFDTVTDDVRNIRLDGELTIEICAAGPMVATGNPFQDAANTLKQKNHITYFANVHTTDANKNRRTIRWAMDIDDRNGSNQVRYHTSDRSSLSDSDAEGKPAVYSDIGSIAAPPSIPSDENVTLPPFRDHNISSAPSSVSGSGGSHDAGPQDTDSVIFAPLPEGPPKDGVLNIKIRGYLGISRSALKGFTFRIIDQPTFGQFLDALVMRGMLPFKFRKRSTAFFGCRHFAYAFLFTHNQSYAVLNLPSFNSAEAFEAWKAAGLVQDVCTTTRKHLSVLIGIRYTRLDSLPADPENSEDEGTTEGIRETLNAIDKGYFPVAFVPLTGPEYRYAA